MLNHQSAAARPSHAGMVNIIREGQLDLDRLATLLQKPALFEPGEPLFWDDPYISAQMLKAHLDPNWDAASRKPETIDRSVEWLCQQMALTPGKRLLDLACGPGLYSSRFARRNLKVVGIDYSRRSIEYAKQRAQEEGLSIEYIYRDLVEINYSEQFDAAVFIYGDFCTLSDTGRDKLLGRLNRALAPGGFFAFDVMTPPFSGSQDYLTGWDAAKEGFWRPEPSLELQQNAKYPDDIYLKRHVIIEGNGTVADYRLWNRLFDLENLQKLLRKYDFEIHSAWNDLTGTPYNPASDWLAVLARKE